MFTTRVETAMAAKELAASFVVIVISCGSASASAVTLHNQAWNKGVVIDIRTGTGEDCDNLAKVTPRGTRTVPYQGTTTIDGGTLDVVCYRRDVDQDNPRGTWGSWIRFSSDAEGDIN
jgi:hypothetical protein